MIELNPTRYESLLCKLTDVPINIWFARSVLAGHAHGKVFADKEQEPSSIYICNGCGITLLLGESGNDEFNDEMGRYLRTLDKVERIQPYPRSWDAFLQSLVDQGTARLSTRVNFTFDEQVFAANNSTPDTNGILVRPGSVDIINSIDGSVVPQCFWKESLLHMCKSYVAIVDHEPAAVAFSAYLHSEHLEIGIETAEKHRGKGLATIVCAALIRDCIEAGLTPVWSCRLDNTGSMNLAKRMGFVESARLPYYIVEPVK